MRKINKEDIRKGRGRELCKETKEYVAHEERKKENMNFRGRQRTKKGKQEKKLTIDEDEGGKANLRKQNTKKD